MVIIDRTRCGLSCETGAVLFYPYLNKSHSKFALSQVGAHTDPTNLTELLWWWKISRRFLAQWRNTGGLKQKHKKQPFGDASASHLSLVLWHVWFQANHTPNAALPSEGGGIAKRIKTARLRRKTNLQKSDYPKTRIKRDPNALCVLEYDNLYLYQIINIQCIILIIGGREISRALKKSRFLKTKTKNAYDL